MKRKLKRTPSALALLVAATQFTHAAIFTWDGVPDAGGSTPNNNWNTAGNWVGDVAPTDTNNGNNELVYTGTAARLTSANTSNDFNFGQITFAAGAASYTVGSSARTLLTNGSINQNSSSSQSLNFNILGLDQGSSSITGSGTGLVTFGSSPNNGIIGTRSFSGTNTLTSNNSSFDVVINSTMQNNAGNSGTFAFSKSGTGTTTTTGTNTYTGATSVSGGPLLVNGSHTGGGNYSVTGSGSLGGSGTIALSSSGNTFSVMGTSTSVRATLRPGASGTDTTTMTLGSASINSSVNLNNFSSLTLDIGDMAASDSLSVFGSLNLDGGSSLDLLSLASGAFDGSTYTLASYGSRNGTFGTVTVDGTDTLASKGYQLNYGPTAITLSAIAMGAIPEPSASLLLGAAGMLLMLRRRRG